jgi:signal peptide peptidase SppA
MPRFVEPNEYTSWAVRPEVLPALAEMAREPLSGEERQQLEAHCPDGIVSRTLEARPGGGRAPRVAGAVQVISLRGLITPRASLFSLLFGYGGGGLQSFVEIFEEAVNDGDIGAIVIDIDSPGGRTDLVPETAATIRGARGTKPIIAVANTMAASAAYWLAAQADEVVVTPSGWAGSIGVFTLHNDWSGWNEQRGIVPTYVSAGRFKTEGNPDEPLSDSARAAMQQTVDDFYGLFVESVAEGRGATADAVRNGYGEGRMLTAQRALAENLVDSIETLDDVISRLLGTTADGAISALGRRAAATTVTPPPAPRAEDEDDDDEVNEPPEPDEPDPLREPEENAPDDDDDDDDDLEAAAAARRLYADLTFG